MSSPDFLRFTVSILLALSGMTPPARAAFLPPSNCVAAGMISASGSRSVGISWTDNSTDETHWHIQISSDNGATYGNLTPSLSETSAATGVTETVVWNSAAANKTYLFRVYATNGGDTTAPSNVATATAAAFPLTAALVPNQVAVNLSWPGIPNVSGYDIFMSVAGGAFSYLRTVASSVTTHQITSPTISAAGTYSFFMRPYLGDRSIGQSNTVTTTVNVITSKTGTSGSPGSPFSHTFTQTTASAVSSRSLTGLPSGLTFNSSTGVLGGVYPALGNYTLNYSVNLTNGVILKQVFSIRVRPAAGAPAIGAPIPAWNGIAGTHRDTALAGTFVDPEAESAVRVGTTLGDMDFILFDTATPATVMNFMSYVTSGKYTNVAFHRSIAGFVIQGGGFKGAGTGSSFSSVVTAPPVVNEPGIANLRGTVSMAKVGGNPDSATSQFFISLADNQANLDFQNSGFTVFGRVAGNGMTVADAISNLPFRTYNLFLDGSTSPTAFGNFPMNSSTAPTVMDQTMLVKINSVTSIPTIRYAITGNTNPSVASASIDQAQLRLVGLTGGNTTITVTATDLDNLTKPQNVVVNIQETYGTWASRGAFPGGLNHALQNPDGDALTNLQEYAFFGDPAVASESPMPLAGKTGVSPAPQYLTLTFPVRKFTNGLSYVVEANDALTGEWTVVWSSPDGFEHPQVVAAVDQADRTILTIRDTAAVTGQQQRFLRTRVTQE